MSVKAETEQDFPDRLQMCTETLLTYRARRLEKKKRKQKERGAVMEWVDAFLWAVMVVLLLNQYLLQAYQIPSGSMRHTLIGGIDPYSGGMSTSDRIFVDKVTFGPELLPGVGKLPGLRESRRCEVIIFENPEYESPSLVHEIAQRVLYMVTLSLVDLKRIREVALNHRVTTEQAKRRVIQRESRREAFIRHTFHANISDPLHYDLTINTGKMSNDAAVEAIMGAVMAKLGENS